MVEIMIKRIKDLTEADKKRYLQSIKREIEGSGQSWEFYETKIREEIDTTFDDEAFSKMDPEFAVDAAYARRDFKWSEKHQKPEFVDYILWMGAFCTGSDLVDIV